MKLIFSAVFLSAAMAGSAQNQTPVQKPGLSEHVIVLLTPAEIGNQPGCPVDLTSVALSPAGRVLPVAQWTPGDGSLGLHYRNMSGKAIRSISITAALRVKQNVYAMDATPLELRLSFGGTDALNKALDQMASIPLPKGMYSYGVARAQLDQVTFADGSVWSAGPHTACSVQGAASQRIEAK